MYGFGSAVEENPVALGFMAAGGICSIGGSLTGAGYAIHGLVKGEVVHEVNVGGV